MGTVSQASLNMKAFVIVALVAAVAGEADPYTIGQVLAGQTNGGVLTSTTYHGGVRLLGSPTPRWPPSPRSPTPLPTPTPMLVSTMARGRLRLSPGPLARSPPEPTLPRRSRTDAPTTSE